MLIRAIRVGSISASKPAMTASSWPSTGAAVRTGSDKVLLASNSSGGTSGVSRAMAAWNGSHSSGRPPNKHTMSSVLSASTRVSSPASCSLGVILDRSGQQAVRGIDVAVAVEQEVRGRDRGRQ